MFDAISFSGLSLSTFVSLCIRFVFRKWIKYLVRLNDSVVISNFSVEEEKCCNIQFVPIRSVMIVFTHKEIRIFYSFLYYTINYQLGIHYFFLGAILFKRLILNYKFFRLKLDYTSYLIKCVLCITYEQRHSKRHPFASLDGRFF